MPIKRIDGTKFTKKNKRIYMAIRHIRVGTLAPSELLEFLKWMSLFTPLSKTTLGRSPGKKKFLPKNSKGGLSKS